MKKHRVWIVVGVALLIAVTLLVRNAIESPMTPRGAEEWSRGRIIGKMSVKRPVALEFAPDGGVLVGWPNLDGRLELAHIGVDGEVLADRVIPIATRKARDPQLLVGQDGRLRLLYREQQGQDAGIYYTMVEADGTPLGRSQLISEPGSRISDAPLLVQGKAGLVHVLWADDSGIRWAVLDEAGEVTSSILLIPEGSSPMVRSDAAGRLHLVWLYRVRGGAVTIYYGVLDPEQGELSEPEEIAEVVVSALVDLEAVGLGLDRDMGYVFWSEYNSRYYVYTFQYAVFPLDAPQQRRIVPWELRRGAGPLTIAPLEGQQSPLPVALSEHTSGEGDQVEMQVSLITVGAGHDTVEKIVSGSSQSSTEPVLIADGRSNLHMAWVETSGFGEFRVVYASTAPEVMANYNVLTPVDILDAALNSVFRLSTVIVSVLVSLGMWAVVPLIGLGIYHFVTSDEMLGTGRAQAAVIVALAVEVALSFVFPPRLGVDITWSVLRWVVPAVCAVVTAALMVIIVRRRDQTHLFGAFFLFTIVYVVLQTILFLLF